MKSRVRPGVIYLLAVTATACQAPAGAEPGSVSRSAELVASIRLDAPGNSLGLEAGLSRALSGGLNLSAALGFERAGPERSVGGLSESTIYVTAGLDHPLAASWSVQACLTQAVAGDGDGVWAADGETTLGAGVSWSRSLGPARYWSVELMAETERLSGDDMLSLGFLVGLDF